MVVAANPNLLLNLPMNEGSGTTLYDYGTNGVNASLSGTPDYVRTKNGAYAVEFNSGGSKHAQVVGLLGEPTVITLCAWVNITTGGSSGTCIVSLGDSAVINLSSSGYPDGFFRNASTWTGIQYNTDIRGTGWRFIAYVCDPSNSRQEIYLDADLDETSSVSNAINYDQGSNTEIARHGNGSGNFNMNDGEVAEIMAFDKALSQAEITAIYNSTYRE